MDDRAGGAFIEAGECLILAAEGRAQLVRLVGSTIASCCRRVARHVGPMRGSVTAPRSGTF